MVGKGRRRREKNYKAAHGGGSTLPPPPDFSKLDALPAKLRQLMAFTSRCHDSSVAPTDNNQRKSRRKDGHRLEDEKASLREEHSSRKVTSDVSDHNEREMSPQPNEETDDDISDKKKKKKRKRGQVEDLRFQSLVEGSSRRKERRKMRQKEYKDAKKNKRKRAEEENQDFPKHEKVKFGEVVEAPPKLVSVPKGLKTPMDVSKERIRLQAVEAYRSRKGWSSRPGSHKFPLVDTLLQS